MLNKDSGRGKCQDTKTGEAGSDIPCPHAPNPPAEPIPWHISSTAGHKQTKSTGHTAWQESAEMRNHKKHLQIPLWCGQHTFAVIPPLLHIQFIVKNSVFSINADLLPSIISSYHCDSLSFYCKFSSKMNFLQ